MTSPEPAGAQDAPSAPSFSLKPWPTDGERKPKNLAEFIARVNIERGGFRNVTEAGLRDEILQRAAEEASTQNRNGDDVEMQDGASESESETDEEGDGEIKDAIEAKAQIMRSLDVAHNTALLTLDFISLLLTKESPAQAAQTLSPMLREYVGIGTVGAGKIALPSDSSNAYSTHPNPARINNPAKAADDEAVSVGWTMVEIDSTRAAAASAADVLAAEATREARYWSDVMRVRDAGWTLCRLPSERQMLGVQFGFREAAGEFRGGGWASLRRDDENGGAVVLDTGRLGTGSQRLVVTVERDGKVTGRSSTVPPLPESIPLEARVLEARNTIFAQELWHELHREARNLHANGMRVEGSKLTWTMDSGTKICFELETPGETELPFSQECLAVSDNAIAETAHLSLHMLLSHTHRENETRRLKPSPPHQPRTAPSRQTCLLARPLLEHIMHREHISNLLDFLGDLVATLHRAGIPEAGFKVQTNLPASVAELAASASSSGTDRSSAPQALTSQLISQRMVQIDFTITSNCRLTTRSLTVLNPVSTISFVRPVAGADGTNTLAQSCPPVREYHTLTALCDYLRLATERSLVEYALGLISQQPNRVDWAKDVSGSKIRQALGDQSETSPATELGFRVHPSAANESKGASDDQDIRATDDTKPSVHIVLVSIAKDHETMKVTKRRMAWTSRGQGCFNETLGAVVIRSAASLKSDPGP